MKPSKLLLPAALLAAPCATHADPGSCAPTRKSALGIGAEFPNLAKYRDADMALGAPKKGEKRVVFFGDSITEYWKLDESFPGKGYVNRGISGQTTEQMRFRFCQDVINLKPAVVVILAGTNDIAGNTGPIPDEGIEAYLRDMAELSSKYGIKVVLASILPAARYPWKPDVQPVDRILAINAWIKDYAAKNGLVHLDYYSAMVDHKHGLPPALAGDGVHPNKAGYAIMAPLASEAIGRALSDRRP